MRFVQYSLKSSPNVNHVAIRHGQEIIDLKSIKADIPNNFVDVLKHHATFLQELER